jgi:hypothetical protein
MFSSVAISMYCISYLHIPSSSLFLLAMLSGTLRGISYYFSLSALFWYFKEYILTTSVLLIRALQKKHKANELKLLHGMKTKYFKQTFCFLASE